MKYFHVYSDHKTVKEISFDEFTERWGRKGWLIGWISDREILFFKGCSVICLSLRQLQQILNLQQEEKPGREK